MFTDISGVYLVVTLGSIIISLSIHEVMHGFVAHWLGDDTAHLEGRLTLNPLAHIDVVTTILLPMVLILMHLPPILAARPVPVDPSRLRYGDFGGALVGVAGPLTNLVLATVAALIFRVAQPEIGGFIYNSILIFTAINVGFFVFNMIPFPPLDGSRLLYAFVPENVQEIMRQIEAAGFMIILFVFLFAFQFVSGPLIRIQQLILQFLLG